LAATSKPHIFIAGHEPAFKAIQRAGLDNYPTERDAFWASIRSAGGRTYFCGHDHFYNHARLDDGDGDPNNDIHQYIVGTSGFLYSWDYTYPGNNSHYTVELCHYARRNGYLLVEVNDLNVTLTWMQRHTNNPNITGIYEPNEVWSYAIVPRPIVLSPNGNEKLVTGNTYTIAWKTLEGVEIGYVTIEYSPDNGQSWQHIDTRQNTGSYQWDIPLVDSNQCLVRVSDSNDMSRSDTSDGVFTIFQCHRALKGDLNGDCYVDTLDFVILADDWLKCANPLDASGDIH